MNIDRLRYFAAVVETKSLRRASELIGINPGSLSKALSTLESELGFELLRPEGRGIEVTEQGLRIYRSSAVLLDEFRRFRESASRENPSPGPRHDKIRIGTFEVFSSYFGAEFIRSEIPDLEVQILELAPRSIEKAILDRLVDFGITYLPAPDPALTFVPVGEFRMGVFGTPGWRKRPFEEWPFAIPTTAVRIHSQEFQSLDLWPVSIRRRIKYEFELLETALQTTRLGLSVLHCPDLIVRLQNRQVVSAMRLQELPYPRRLRQEMTKVFLVARKDHSSREKMEKKVARFFRSVR